jgi:hypothetical protein
VVGYHLSSALKLINESAVEAVEGFWVSGRRRRVCTEKTENACEEHR